MRGLPGGLVGGRGSGHTAELTLRQACGVLPPRHDGGGALGTETPNKWGALPDCAEGQRSTNTDL